ncbi:hypothetical protein FUAX_46300 (plasmid) [Fulvitalea axinellae]|uniref:DUF779 domain-containing protein n=1 Tax=Fulvitalea axinellae TaxID=1182444 RepID=A0AAU9CW14_9BACT|nr:hypothetical protein FUAX_46300 [Fulvitalea axinellae]
MEQKRVLVTEKAIEWIEKLRAEHGELMFHQSGGCCDGSKPMCYPEGEFRIGQSDVFLGKVHGCGFYMAKYQFEYWQYSELTLDIIDGRGSSFSLEAPYGVRFTVYSRLFTEEEIKQLEPVS